MKDTHAFLAAILILFVRIINAQFYDYQAEVIVNNIENQLQQIAETVMPILKEAKLEGHGVKAIEQRMQLVGGFRSAMRSLQEAQEQAKAIPANSITNKTLDRCISLLKSASSTDMRLMSEAITLHGKGREQSQLYSKKMAMMIGAQEEQLKQEWMETRKSLRRGLASHDIMDYNRLVMKLATAAGMNNTEYYYKDYENPGMFSKFEALIEDLKPFYQLIHSYIRYKLHEVYGPDKISLTGGIPHHLFEKVMAHEWKRNGLLELSDPVDKGRSFEKELIDQEFTADKLYKLAETFFVPPMKRLPPNFWEEMIFENDDEHCVAEIHKMGGVAVMSRCKDVDFGRFLEAHGMMTQWHYYQDMEHLPRLLQGETAPGMADAVAYTVLLSVQSNEYLSSRMLSSHSRSTPINNVFRRAVRFMLELYVNFVHEKLIVEYLEDNVGVGTMNCRYWELMAEYMGVEPPESYASSSNEDLPLIFYESLSVISPNSKKLFSEPLSYAIAQKMCVEFEYSKEFNPDCNFCCDEDSMTFLPQLSVGKSMSWEDLLIQASSEFSSPIQYGSEPIKTYYSGVQDWLTNNAVRNNIHLGWSIPKNCV